MQRSIRMCFYNTDDESGEQIRRPLREVSHLQVLCECNSWEDTRNCLNGTQVDMVLVNLDPDLAEALHVVQLIGRLTPGIGIIGVSQHSDPDTIIRAMRAGCSQFVCSPIELEDLNNAVTRIEATRVNRVHVSRRICVLGSAGGVGATMVACNLALELAHLTDRPSALLDLNLEFGDVAASFDCRPKYSLADLCLDDADLDRTMVESAIHTLPCNVHILGRPENLEDTQEVQPDKLDRLLNLLSGMYANIVLDLPRHFSPLNSAALERADMVLIIAQLSVPSIRNARRLYDLLLQSGVDEECVEIVLNRYKADHERISPDDVEQHFARPVFAMIPNDYRRVMAALDFGHPILADAPTSPARMAIYEMAKKITQDLKGEEAEAQQRRGIFGRILGKKQSVS